MQSNIKKKLGVLALILVLAFTGVSASMNGSTSVNTTVENESIVYNNDTEVEEDFNESNEEEVEEDFNESSEEEIEEDFNESSEEEVEEEKEENNISENMSSDRVLFVPHGAKVRLLQLERRVDAQLENAEFIIEKVENNNISVNVSKLQEIKYAFSELKSEINVSDLNGTPDELAKEFVALKKEATNLTKEFRTTVSPALTPELKEQIREHNRENIKEKRSKKNKNIEKFKNQYRAERAEKVMNNFGIENKDIIERIKNGNLTGEEIKEHIMERVGKIDNERRKQGLKNIKSQREEEMKEVSQKKKDMRDEIREHRKAISKEIREHAKERAKEHRKMAKNIRKEVSQMNITEKKNKINNLSKAEMKEVKELKEKYNVDVPGKSGAK